MPGPVGEAPLVAVAAVRGREVLRQGLDDLEVPGLHRVVAVADLGFDDILVGRPRRREAQVALLQSCKKIAARRALAVILASLRYR